MKKRHPKQPGGGWTTGACAARVRAAGTSWLNGWRKNAGGALETYLPYGEAEEGHLNYEPTLLPVAVGGYYWVVFTSRRAFGNTIYDGSASLPGLTVDVYDRWLVASLYTDERGAREER